MSFDMEQRKTLNNIWNRGYNVWWHGTDHEKGINILRNGPDVNPGNIGTAFYLSEDYNFAKAYSKSFSRKYSDPQPFKAVVEVEVIQEYHQRILFDTWKEHGKRMQKHGDANQIQEWAINQGYLGYGHFVKGSKLTEIKLAIYDPRVLNILRLHVENEI